MHRIRPGNLSLLLIIFIVAGMAFTACNEQPAGGETKNGSGSTGTPVSGSGSNPTDTTTAKSTDTTNTQIPEFTWAGPAKEPGYEAVCGKDVVDLGKPVLNIALSLERDSVMYDANPEKMADCSGIFHRVLEAIQRKCSNHETPTFEQARDSRQLAGWYQERRELILVHNPLEMAELIKPGAVLFYGKDSLRYKEFTTADLVGSPGKKGIVFHIGVVVDVERDSSGIITDYYLFHGRSDKKIAAITRWNWRKESVKHPAYGNGNEQWLAIAPILGQGTEDVGS